MKSIWFFSCTITLLVFASVSALENGLARTPPMGFNTWNWFGCGDRNRGAISESLIKGIADAMVSTGMKNAGYLYVNIDDCWAQQGRNAQGAMVPSSNFPSGMRALADYVHSKGLKLGIYTDVAALTCSQRMPGMLDHENQDADSFVSWGIDYVKVDWCSGTGSSLDAYTNIRNALRSAVTRMSPTVPTAHEIVFSICNWGQQSPWTWGAAVGNLWRTTGDIDMTGGCGGSPCWGGIMANMDGTVGLYSAAGPGHWNDPDMLEVGNGLTNNEERAHFSLWCMLAAPLIAGNDIRSMSAATKAVLTNTEAIAINQDSLGYQGRRIRNNNQLEVWTKNLQNGDKAVCLFNRSGSAATMSFTVTDIGMTAGASIRDVWAHQDKGVLNTSYSVSVASHDVAMFRISNRISVLQRSKQTSDAFGIFAKSATSASSRRIDITITGTKAGETVLFSLFSMSGRLLRNFLQQNKQGGNVQIAVDCTDNRGAALPLGNYLVRANVYGHSAIKTANLLVNQ